MSKSVDLHSNTSGQLHMFILLVANGWVTERPVNMVAVQGTTINFSCASNERGKVRWDFYKFGSVNPYDVWNGESAQNPFSVNVEQCQLETRCSLLAERVSRDIAGSYVCRRAAGFGEFLASLIVLGETAMLVQSFYAMIGIRE
jgi:hypothetical protein